MGYEESSTALPRGATGQSRFCGAADIPRARGACQALSSGSSARDWRNSVRACRASSSVDFRTRTCTSVGASALRRRRITARGHRSDPTPLERVDDDHGLHFVRDAGQDFQRIVMRIHVVPFRDRRESARRLTVRCVRSGTSYSPLRASTSCAAQERCRLLQPA
jgi:hypothetical protein